MNENSMRAKRLSIKNIETHLSGDKWQIERQKDRLIDGRTNNSAILVTVVFCLLCFYNCNNLASAVLLAVRARTKNGTI
jgi:hypothetical protein